MSRARPRGASSLLAAALLLFSSSGCVSLLLPTDLDRTESWKPFETDKVGLEPLAGYMSRRCGLVIRSIVSIKPEGRSYVIEESGLGTAAALTADGYMLTAAHCVTEPYPHVIIVTRSGRRIIPARIVWKGDPEDEARDLALLKVDQPLIWTFDFAESGEVREGSDLVGAGFGNAVDHALPRVFGGLCTETPRFETRAGGVRTSVVRGNLPFVPGDSGGPLLTRTGGLIAINTRVTVSVFHAPRSLSLAPDPTWVDGVIEADRRRMSERFVSR